MIAVVGAGAVGGLLAAELIAVGRSVTVCSRSPLDRIVVERAEQPLDVAVSSVTAPDSLTQAEWAFVALKGPDLPAPRPGSQPQSALRPSWWPCRTASSTA